MTTYETNTDSTPVGGDATVGDVPSIGGDDPVNYPLKAARAEEIAARGQYRMSSWPRTGALLRTLVASKPGGRMLELGGGLGVGAAWMLDGMDATSQLVSVEVSERVAYMASKIIGDDPRYTVVVADALEWLTAYDGELFDFVFLDTTTSKFERRDAVYPVLAEGALVVADDLLPNDTWDETHPARVARFREEILTDPYLVPLLADWCSGVLIAAYRSTDG